MDNVTHTLIGVVVGHSLNQLPAMKKAASKSGDAAAFSRAVVWSSIIGSNLPDLDFVYTWISGHATLGYLLHHRGHTHTFAIALALAPLAAWLGARFARLRTLDRRTFLRLFGAAALACVGHIAADFPNDYGIHPFFPFSQRWHYGDFLFIIEPLLITAMLPWAILRAGSRLTRWLWIALGIGFLAMIGSGAFIHPEVAAIIFVWSAIFFGLSFWKKSLKVTWAGIVLTYLVFGVASLASRRAIHDRLRADFPGERWVQLATTPYPANPLCWRTIAVSATETDYIARVGAFSLIRDWNAVRCMGKMLDTRRTAPLRPVTGASDGSPQLTWIGEFRRPLRELHELKQTRCDFAAFLEFARAPFWKPFPASLAQVAGDLRYDRQEGSDFAEISLLEDPMCPRFDPQWEYPLFELFPN